MNKSAAALLLALILFPAASHGLARPVDSKLFCGEGMDGYAQAIAYIQTRATNQASITKLTPEFACSLAAFLKAAPPAIGVKVGWYEVTASVATHGVSYCQHYQCKEGTNSHPRGLAADLLFGGTKGPGGNGGPAWCAQNTLCTWAHQNAHAHGLMFRLMPGSGCAAGYFEPWHIELKGVANCQGSDTFTGMTASAAPLGIGDAFRAMIGQDKPAAVQPAQPALPAQTISQTQSPITSFETGTGYPIQDDSGNPLVSDQLNTNEAGKSGTTSAADRLAGLAFGVQATSSQTATSVPLVVSGADAAGLTANPKVATAQIQPSGNSPASQQTFISGDLSWQQDTTLSPNAVSGWEAILITIKAALLRMLPYIEPFGAREMPEVAN